MSIKCAIFLLILNEFCLDSFKYDLDEVVQRELRKFFDAITKDQFDIPDEFKTRDFVHLYDFQKYFLHKSIEHLKELVHKKQEQDWPKYNHSDWDEPSK